MSESTQEPEVPSSSSKFSQLRRAVVEARNTAQKHFRKDSGLDAPESAFTRIAIEKVRSDLKAHYDSKTELLNHQAFIDAATLEIQKVKRDPKHHSLFIGLSDFDNFGALNQRYGEIKVDGMLKIAADTYKKAVRPTDLTGRIGGEEFGFAIPYEKFNSKMKPPAIDSPLFPGTRIREAIASIPVSDDFPEKLTASIGVSEYLPGETFNDCMNRASLAARIAKLTGKNATVVAHREGDNQWLYKDITNSHTYRPNFDPTNKLLSLDELSEGKHYEVLYESGKKPKLNISEAKHG